MRTLTPDFDPETVAEIDARLADAVAEHDVTIPWAIESGSRAWGFPSPDSDYDCRFLYVRSRNAYLSPWRPRDVIETPLTEVLDVNGWDLIKAVQLAVKGNATVAEWLRSPLVYAGVPAFAETLLTLVSEVADVHTIRRHYLHVGRTAWGRAEPDARGHVPLKKVFYSLRPAAVLRWLREHGTAVPPMHLPTLFEQAPPRTACAGWSTI
ncbi:nucleotidyltransferase domain-containing protein [Ammonicoccus fulvus]|uniref:Nucleotidyltransferase domain-containing protein n=1 Tax=Ammonicoccus fulvus TaxID=3138240 RepID=A0ABZ3FKT1_9ACTN